MTIQSISYVTTTTFELIANRINGAKRIVVTTHRKPDGDAIGSVVGMYRALRSIDKEVEVLIAGPLEHGLAIIAGDTPLRFIEDDGFPEEVPDLTNNNEALTGYFSSSLNDCNMPEVHGIKITN